MKADISKIRPYSVWFVAECADDIFMLGQFASKIEGSTKGLTLDSRISLEVPILSLLNLAIENKQGNIED